MERPVFNVTTARWEVFDPAIARAEAMKQHPTARPSLHVLLGALDAVADEVCPFGGDECSTCRVLAYFTVDERALAAVELDAWLEAHP